MISGRSGRIRTCDPCVPNVPARSPLLAPAMPVAGPRRSDRSGSTVAPAASLGVTPAAEPPLLKGGGSFAARAAPGELSRHLRRCVADGEGSPRRRWPPRSQRRLAKRANWGQAGSAHRHVQQYPPSGLSGDANGSMALRLVGKFRRQRHVAAAGSARTRPEAID